MNGSSVGGSKFVFHSNASNSFVLHLTNILLLLDHLIDSRANHKKSTEEVYCYRNIMLHQSPSPPRKPSREESVRARAVDEAFGQASPLSYKWGSSCCFLLFIFLFESNILPVFNTWNDLLLYTNIDFRSLQCLSSVMDCVFGYLTSTSFPPLCSSVQVLYTVKHRRNFLSFLSRRRVWSYKSDLSPENTFH